jgi:hypothetical protein
MSTPLGICLSMDRLGHVWSRGRGGHQGIVLCYGCGTRMNLQDWPSFDQNFYSLDDASKKPRGTMITIWTSLTMKLYVKLPPGGIEHWLTPEGPSIVLVPCCLLTVSFVIAQIKCFHRCPWKWIPVVSFPSRFTTLTTMVSPRLATTAGNGNWPFIPGKH